MEGSFIRDLGFNLWHHFLVNFSPSYVMARIESAGCSSAERIVLFFFFFFYKSNLLSRSVDV